MANNQLVPIVVASITVVGVFLASWLRDRNNPMQQVVTSAVANTVSMSAQLRYHEIRARHYESYAYRLRQQLQQLGVEPVEEPPLHEESP